MFSEIDQNKDGAVSADEWANFENEGLPEESNEKKDQKADDSIVVTMPPTKKHHRKHYKQHFLARRAILKRAFSQAAKIAKAAISVSKDAYETHDVKEVMAKFGEAHDHMTKVLGKVVSKVQGKAGDVKDKMKDAIRKKFIIVNP